MQDWNVSRKELKELVYAGVLTEDEIEEVISIEFNPVSQVYDLAFPNCLLSLLGPSFSFSFVDFVYSMCFDV